MHMKRTIVGSLASVFVASALVAAQGASSAPSQAPAAAQSAPAAASAQAPSTPGSTTVVVQQKSDSDKDKKDITLTGCLVQGSSPSVFILEDARPSTQASSESGKSYIVTAIDSGLDIKGNLNHRVTIVGASPMVVAARGGAEVAVGAPAPGSSARVEVEKDDDKVTVKVEEKDMPKLVARTVMSISTSCTPAE
jgi:uncharacterized protein YdeI (BOF family)